MKPDRHLVQSLVISIIISAISIAFISCTSGNHAPIISELLADKDQLCLKSSCKLDAVVVDCDEDELTYEWVVPFGTIKGKGASIVWKAPTTPGTYAIMLVVTDGRGGEATKALTITVISNSSPIIERLSSKLVVCRDEGPIPIECVASDPDGDELSYRWTATRGEISGQGPTIHWIPPDKNGSYTVAVEVTDGNGGEVAKEKSIRVT